LTDSNFCAALTLIIQAAVDGIPRHEVVLTVGQTPTLLAGLGLPDLPLVVTGKTIDKIFFDHAMTKGKSPGRFCRCFSLEVILTRHSTA
jgi:hypothetical protein